MRYLLASCFFFLLYVSSVSAQELKESLFSTPPRYHAVKIKDSLQIDGEAKELVWEQAPWITTFQDIAGTGKTQQNGTTRVKILWDDQYLYLYAELKAQDIWATITERDRSVFQENALELFIDPDADTQEYLEFQINALSTVWDLIMSKPYRNGGRSWSDWDVKGLKKAVHLKGTINQPQDIDESWSVELAFPMKSLALGTRKKPEVGDAWKMNMSRVEWELEKKGTQYQKALNEQGKAKDPAYWVWSPQGVVNLHMPERWGYVILADEHGQAAQTEKQLDKLAHAQQIVWKVYYLQEAYKNKYHRFASQISELKEAFPLDVLPDDPALSMEGSAHQFWIAYAPAQGQLLVAVNQEGKVFYDWP